MDRTKRIEFLGCPFDAVSKDEAIEECERWCQSSDAPRTLITMNASLLVMIRQNKDLQEACLAGDLIVPDGIPVVWASRIVGTPLTERIAGVEFMGHLLEMASREGLRVFFLGARQEVLDKLVEICAVKYPGAIVAGFRNGYFSEGDESDLVDEIAKSEADILFVGMPSPFKEVWCQKHRNELGVSVIMGVGGSFDVHAGFIRRAPRWIQNIGMEWSWRLAMEPRKLWKRYLVSNTAFILMTLHALFKNRVLGVVRRS